MEIGTRFNACLLTVSLSRAALSGLSAHSRRPVVIDVHVSHAGLRYSTSANTPLIAMRLVSSFGVILTLCCIEVAVCWGNLPYVFESVLSLLS